MSGEGVGRTPPESAATTSSTCGSCGTANRPDARWCSNCAQPLPSKGDKSVAGDSPGGQDTAKDTPAAQDTSKGSEAPKPDAPSTPTSSPPIPPSSPSSPGAPSPARPAAGQTRPVPAPKDTKPAFAPPPPVVPAKPLPEPSKKEGGRNLVPFLTLTTLVFLGTTLVFGWMAFRSPSTPLGSGQPVSEATGEAVTERDVIEETARRFMDNFLNYNYETVEDDVALALEDATDDFGVRSLAVLTGGDVEGFKEAIVQRNGVGSARVVGASLTSRDGDTATIIIVARRTYDNNQLSQPREELLNVELTLVNTDEGWKVDILSEPDGNG